MSFHNPYAMNNGEHFAIQSFKELARNHVILHVHGTLIQGTYFSLWNSSTLEVSRKCKTSILIRNIIWPLSATYLNWHSNFCRTEKKNV